ncbi:MAG TPA: AMP-binding protein [Actinomycetota bacterium]|nr:AMP-binding protein [Actinomycetota bacterium]
MAEAPAQQADQQASQTPRYPTLPQRAVAQRAKTQPDEPAIISAAGDRTWAELDGRTNQLVRAMRARGIEPGQSIALVCSNRPEFAETYLAAARNGLRLTPINWHLGADEMAYIINDCDASLLVGDERFAKVCAEAATLAPKTKVRLGIGGPIEGFEDYEAALDGESSEPVENEGIGTTMLYTSGTTGRPKGVFRRRAAPRRAQNEAVRLHEDGDLHLCTGPLYHAAPLAFSLGLPYLWGIGVVIMDGWDPEETLRLIEKHRVTHVHLVPIMFHRLLSLPEEVRSRYDVSSLKRIGHGAAPCPVHVKKAMIEWVGPIIWEYYAATEGAGTSVESDEWLTKPGTVGKVPENHVEIRDDEGNVVPTGEVGTIYLRAPEEPETRFEYYKDTDKTSRAYSGDFFTLGDMGYVDEDGYLFLTDRSADLIISGGVNIYPAEVDAVMLTHPAVRDSCTIGIPNEEWGEEVMGIIELKPSFEPSDELANELIAYSRERLAHFKCPKSIAFDADLPRHETGKLYRRLVRERYRGN